MIEIADKNNNTPGASGELTAEEYNDHKNELQNTISTTGQIFSEIKTPDQLPRAMFIYGVGSQTMQDGAPSSNIIELTPKTGINGLIVPDSYAQMDGVQVEFVKVTANTSTTVNVNFGQSSGTLLGAKALKYPDGSDPAVGEVIGRVKIEFDVSLDYWKVISPEYVLPIGAIYMQLPGELAPDSMFFGTWSNVSASFAGAFFRAEGGNASVFGSGVQDYALRQHDHYNGIAVDAAGAGINVYGTTTAEMPGSSSRRVDTVAGGNSNQGYTGLVTNVTELDNNEGRPVNYTVRIWKRTA